MDKTMYDQLKYIYNDNKQNDLNWRLELSIGKLEKNQKWIKEDKVLELTYKIRVVVKLWLSV